MDAASSPPLRIAVVDTLDVVLVCVYGELDIETVPSLRATMTPFVDRRVELDLTETTFIGSSGINTLLVLQSQCSQAGGHALVVHASAHVRRVFHMAGVDDLLCDGRDPDAREGPPSVVLANVRVPAAGRLLMQVRARPRR